MKRPIFWLLAIVLVLASVNGAMAITYYDQPVLTTSSSATVNQCVFYHLNSTQNITVSGIQKNSSSTARVCYLYAGTVKPGTTPGDCRTGGTVVANGTFTVDTCTFNTTLNVGAGQNFTIAMDNRTSSWTQKYGSASSMPVNGNTTYIRWIGASSDASTIDGLARSIIGIFFTLQNNIIPIINISLLNAVNGSSWPSTVTFSNKTGTLDFAYFNITGTGFCVTLTGNGTATNCTATGSGASTFYNVSNTSVSVTDTQSVTAATYQATINVSAYRLFLNTSISSYNTTNGIFKNASGSLVYANNGSNNIQVDVAGNYSKNVTCTVNTPLTTASCNATGIYDDLFTIGGKNATSGTGINTFTSRMINDTIGASVSISTTTGNATFQTIQGYTYFFDFNATNFEYLNVTIPANASTNLYNFSARVANSFNFTVYNETTNTLITQNVTLQIVSGDFAANYTFTGGRWNVTLLTPGDYTFTYWVDPDVPRNYYYTLSSQSYNDIKLYVVDASISNLYLPIIINSNTVPVANVTVQLLRDYIISGNTHAYSIVEMAKTDTNGQAVLRVVPNIVFYKLIITDGTNTLSTEPTKFTANTNTYTFNTEGNPTESLVGYQNIAKGLTFDNSTLTYTFTWADTQNIVSSGCLKVTKFKNGVQTTPLNGCVAGSSGSITHTINDTNGTSYNAVATLTTSTQFSTLNAGSLSVNFDSTYGTFGIVGFLITFIIFLTFVFVGGESGTAGALVSGFVAIIIAGAFGFISSNWSLVVIPVAVIIGIIIYRLRS